MKWSTITRTCSTLGNSLRSIVVLNELKSRWTSWRGLWPSLGPSGPFLFSPHIKLTSSTILDHSVDIHEDSRQPESIRDETLHSLLALVACIITTIYGSPPVCSRHNEMFHFFDLVFRLVPLVWQSSRQGEFVSILQYTSYLWSIFSVPQLSRLFCPWLRFFLIEVTPVHGGFNLRDFMLGLSLVCDMHLCGQPHWLCTHLNEVSFMLSSRVRAIL